MTPREVAALDPVAYVRRIAPFDRVPEELFLDAARGLEIGLFEANLRLAAAGGEPLRDLYVIRRGAVRLEREGHVLQVLEEGELFGYTSLISNAGAPAARARRGRPGRRAGTVPSRPWRWSRRSISSSACVGARRAST